MELEWSRSRVPACFEVADEFQDKCSLFILSVASPASISFHSSLAPPHPLACRPDFFARPRFAQTACSGSSSGATYQHEERQRRLKNALLRKKMPGSAHIRQSRSSWQLCAHGEYGLIMSWLSQHEERQRRPGSRISALEGAAGGAVAASRATATAGLY